MAERKPATKLDPHEVRCLEMLALFADPIPRTRLFEALRASDVRVPGAGGRTKALSTTALKPMLERWRDDGHVLVDDHDRWMCHPIAAHALLDRAAADGRLAPLAAAVDSNHYYPDDADVVARVRAALYARDPAKLEEALDARRWYGRSDSRNGWLLDAIHPMSPKGAIELLPAEVQPQFAVRGLTYFIDVGVCPRCDLVRSSSTEGGAEVRGLAALLLALAGEAPDEDDDLSGLKHARVYDALFARALARGHLEEARALAAAALEASRGPSRRKKPLLDGPIAPLLTLALATGAPEQMALARMQLERARKKKQLVPADHHLDAFLSPSGPVAYPLTAPHGWLDGLLALHMSAWLMESSGEGRDLKLRSFEVMQDRLEAEGLRWVSAQYRVAIGRLKGDGTVEGPSLLALYKPQPAWCRVLDALEAEVSDSAPVEAAAEERLVWLVNVAEPWTLDDDDPAFDALEAEAACAIHIEPRLQKKRGRGWTSGRKVALKRLVEKSDAPWLTKDDLRVVGTIRMAREWYGNTRYYFSPKAPLALVGHPCVFLVGGTDDPISVVRGEQRIRVERGDEGRIVVSVHPYVADTVHVTFDEGGRALRVYEVDEQARRIQRLLEDGAGFPPEAEARVKALLGKLSSVLPVHSDVEADATEAEPVPADPRPVAFLSREGDGIRVQLRVCPLGLDGPKVRAGVGGASLTTNVAGRVVSCTRDRDGERARCHALEEACPALFEGEMLGPEEYALPGLAESLDLLLQLGDLGDDVTMAWPDKAPLKIARPKPGKRLSVQLRSADEWLAASGSLTLDDDLVLDLRTLLEAVSSAEGRFIRLSDERFLALTDDLQARLRALSAAARATKNSKGNEVNLHPLAAGVFSGWTHGKLTPDRGTKQLLKRVEAAAALKPKVPRTFEAKLRPYQRAGFDWLSRLSHWNAGAVLADDMGLGKTIQTLALLVDRASHGPALVVAPTSVCANWEMEAERFAPSLNLIRVDGSTDAIEVAEFDVLVMSYTVLTLNIDWLEQARFATVVLDEAQAIKNAATRRARAGRRLRADFRMVTTGTPIENHLGELWSIMEFVNPGLLGTQQQFSSRFTTAVQRGDEDAVDRLRALIRPFILRRTKRSVLKELPPRTEITLLVEPGKKEAAFSEALRQRALERLASQRGPASKKVANILAELTRLRQAACHPRLVDSELQLSSAKLEELLRLVDELKSGGHRALIFSQFVRFLNMVKPALDAAGVSYQTLDGSTPAKERTERVARFQDGEGDVFLLSLKAGGMGLNLTGADYVIHLDPWWNPAVENQASDRAHRIGQRRPVTVYRLVTKGSIEERVVELHRDKQDLAEQLLADTGTAKTLDAEALLALLEG